MIDKKDAHARKGIFMIDASADFMKDGPKNRLRSRDIHKIVDTFNKQIEEPGYSRMVGIEEVERNEYNLNLPRYIDNRQAEDLQDLNAPLKGGVPAADIDALQEYWTVCPTLRTALFKKNRAGYLDLAVSKNDIKTAIHEHAEFRTFIDSMNEHFDTWRNRWAGEPWNAELQSSPPGNAELQLGLTTLKPGFHPKELIVQLSEDLLKHYLGQPLMDAYGVYQILMDYWAETMQDDAYAVAVDGWQAKPTRIVEVDKKGKEKDKGWACDLIPKPLIAARYFAEEQSALDALSADLETVSARLAELEEEHGGEEGAFAELEKVNKGEVARRLKEISSLGTPGAREALGTPSSSSALNETDHEPAILQEWLDTNSRESDLKKQIKKAEAELDAAAYAKYAELTEKEIKELVIEAKWLATLSASVHGEMDRISQTLTRRVKELAERYETPLPDLATRADALEEKVRGHLIKMGFQA